VAAAPTLTPLPTLTPGRWHRAAPGQPSPSPLPRPQHPSPPSPKVWPGKAARHGGGVLARRSGVGGRHRWIAAAAADATTAVDGQRRRGDGPDLVPSGLEGHGGASVCLSAYVGGDHCASLSTWDGWRPWGLT
jgi:hypothetical protein